MTEWLSNCLFIVTAVAVAAVAIVGPETKNPAKRSGGTLLQVLRMLE